MSSLLGPVVHSFRALFGRLKLTVRRHKFNKDSLPIRETLRVLPHQPAPPTHHCHKTHKTRPNIWCVYGAIVYCANVCIYVYMYICIYVYGANICIYIYIYIYICIWCEYMVRSRPARSRDALCTPTPACGSQVVKL